MMIMLFEASWTFSGNPLESADHIHTSYDYSPVQLPCSPPVS